MRSIIILIFLVVAPFSTFINGNDDDDDDIPLQDYLNANAADKDFIINGVFKPSFGGFLGEGSFSVLFGGTLLWPSRRNVAMKFTPSMYKMQATKEYEMYWYLNAINNTNVEIYGIPSVYYFGVWGDYVLMAITLMDSKCNVKPDSGQINEIDSLIVCRDFVRIMKYIHSCGISNNDIKLENMMYRGYQAFIIDFNLASKMFGKRRSSTSASGSGNDRKRLVKQDWESFFYSMCFIVDVEVNWLNNKVTLERIAQIKFDKLRVVLNKIAKHLFGSSNQLSNDVNDLSFYDELYQHINKGIGKFRLETPALVSWLSDEARTKGMHESMDDSMAVISTIRDPFQMPELYYPDVQVDFFGGLSHGQSDQMARQIENIIRKLQNQKI